MKLSASFLSIKNNLKENIELLANTNIDYLHLDIMDGIFVNNKTYQIGEIEELFKNIKKKLDVHLMVSDIKKYIDDYARLNPEFITFHFEAANDTESIIKYIKAKNIKVGLSIKPNTDVEVIKEYLPYIDLILVMSVEPGYGGQKFIMPTAAKIQKLQSIRKNYNLSFLIEVDGGINADTIKYCRGADIIVVGSYITNGDNYQKQINNLKKEM